MVLGNAVFLLLAALAFPLETKVFGFSPGR
jgi:hypothetical protein